jgi:stearoyl-CoA desaturase (delta-9 desaturase)
MTWNRIWTAFVRWFDSNYQRESFDPEKDKQIDWARCVPFLGVHVACLAVFWVGWSWTAVTVAAALYFVRMFAITGFYHRYFSHRSYKTSRPFQFVMAILGNASGQRGPLWWAAHHRHHHKHSDEEEDVHSPHTHSLAWSHMFWLMTPENFRTNVKAVPDLAKYPELRFLDRFDSLVPAVLGFGLLFSGFALERWAPSLGVTGMQMLIWGFFVSTVVLFHGTCLINSMAHLFGKQRYKTSDHSRNSFLLSVITLGEGWHNNHHHYPAATRQGFFWWEMDITYYILQVLSWMRLIWDLKPVPKEALNSNLASQAGA